MSLSLFLLCIIPCRVLPVSAQRSFRDGAFRAVSDGGVAVAAGVSAVSRPRLAARFLSVGMRKENHRYGEHPRQVLYAPVLQPKKYLESMPLFWLKCRQKKVAAISSQGAVPRPRLGCFSASPSAEVCRFQTSYSIAGCVQHHPTHLHNYLGDLCHL